MAEFDLTLHAKDMLTERKIPEEWVRRTLNEPDNSHSGNDGNQHYAKAITERSGRVLHVIVNNTVQPNRIVTLFFDRRLARLK